MRAVLCVLLVCLAVAFAFNEAENGVPQTMPQPQSPEVLAACLLCDGRSVPASHEEREVFAIFNSVRTNPKYWSEQYFSNFNNVLKSYSKTTPVHFWYSQAASSNARVHDIADHSPTGCTDPSFVLELCCDKGFDENNNQPTCSASDQVYDCCSAPAPPPYVASQAEFDYDAALCEPNRMPPGTSDTVDDVCCFRTENCTDSREKLYITIEKWGFPWRNLQLGGSGSRVAGMISANLGAFDSVVTWVCDEETPGASDCSPDGQFDVNRVQIMQPAYVNGGSGFTGCANCAYSSYFSFDLGYLNNNQFNDESIIASGSDVSLNAGANGQAAGSYFMASVSTSATVIVAKEDGSVVAMDPFDPTDSGSLTKIASASGGCYNYVFAARAGGTVERYPAYGVLRTAQCGGNGWADLAADACYGAVPSCAGRGVCVSSTVCVCAGDTNSDGSCASLSGSGTLIVSFVLMLFVASLCLLL